MTLTKPGIIETIEREGYTPKQKGKSFWLSCPFHEDRNPSLKIDPEKQTFYCFSCLSSGDSISFIQKLHGLTFRETLRYLSIQDTPKINSQQQTKRTLVKVFREWEKSLKNELTDYYREFKAITGDLKTWAEAEEFEDDFNLMPLAEYFLEILTNGTDEDKYNLYKRMKKNG